MQQQPQLEASVMWVTRSSALEQTVAFTPNLHPERNSNTTSTYVPDLRSDACIDERKAVFVKKTTKKREAWPTKKYHLTSKQEGDWAEKSSQKRVNFVHALNHPSCERPSFLGFLHQRREQMVIKRDKRLHYIQDWSWHFCVTSRVCSLHLHQRSLLKIEVAAVFFFILLLKAQDWLLKLQKKEQPLKTIIVPRHEITPSQKLRPRSASNEIKLRSSSFVPHTWYLWWLQYR
jgi:hypothetical protein